MTDERGFTLVEVLIATAVIALALGAFISGGARHADYARYIHDKTLAQWVARNQLVQFQLAEQWPDTGTQEGEVDMGGGQWQWVAEIEESPDPDVRRIDVRVFRIAAGSGDAQTESIALLSGFVTQRIEPADTPPGGAPGDAGEDDADADAGEGPS